MTVRADLYRHTNEQHNPGEPPVNISAEHIQTIADLVDAAALAGVLPSELIARVWPQHAP